MENEKNEMVLFEGAKKNMFCSKVATTSEEKVDLFNALDECDVLLNDIVDQEIVMKDIYVEQREVMDEETGEMKTKYRTIIFDVNGKTYATGAYGIFNSMKRIINVFGYPTWENGVKVKVIKKKLKSGKSSLSLAMVK